MMGSIKQYADVWNVFKMIFTLSHGQSSIEQSFRINKQFLVENLKTKSLIALRTIEDHMSPNGRSPQNIEISKDMSKNAVVIRKIVDDVIKALRT